MTTDTGARANGIVDLSCVSNVGWGGEGGWGKDARNVLRTAEVKIMCGA